MNDTFPSENVYSVWLGGVLLVFYLLSLFHILMNKFWFILDIRYAPSFNFW